MTGETTGGEVEHLGVPERTTVSQVSKERALNGRQYTFEPTRVECPVCDRDGVTTKRANLCAGCGAWFVVTVNPGAR